MKEEKIINGRRNKNYNISDVLINLYIQRRVYLKSRRNKKKMVKINIKSLFKLNFIQTILPHLLRSFHFGDIKW